MAGIGIVSPGIEAIYNLSHLGYRAWVEGEKVKLCYEGSGDPDPQQVAPLFDLVRQHKEEVRFFLQCHCPKCGGMCFGTFVDGKERCMGCYYQALKIVNLGLELTH